MTITAVSDADAEAVARSIYEALHQRGRFDAARPDVRARYMEAARARVAAAMLLLGMIEAAKAPAE